MSRHADPPPPGRWASLVDLDTDLFEGFSGERRLLARRHLIVRLESVSTGVWRPEANTFGAADGIGLLVVQGLAARRVHVTHRSAAEVLGPGDILRPWQDDGEYAMFPLDADWRILTPMQVAVLDGDFASRAGHFPEVIGHLVGRGIDRSRRIIGQLAVSQIVSVERRLLVMLWRLAERWGRVTAGGIVLDLHMTHEMLGFVVGARRPSVTTALGALATQGLIEVCPGGLLLRGEPPHELSQTAGGAADRATRTDD